MIATPRTTRRLSLRSPLDREIARLAVPAFGALIAEPLYVLTDTAVVGHLGTPQLAGLAVASSVLLTLYAVFIFLAYGTTAAVSRLLGAGDEREAAHQAVQSMWLALVIGLGVTAVGLVLSGPLVGWMGAEGAVRTNALVYLRISLLGVPAMLLVLAGAGYLRGLQDTRTPLLIAIGTAAANLAIEVALIYGLDQGIGASALATVLAQAGGAAVYIRRVGHAARRQGADLAPHPASLAALARVGRDLLVRTAALRAALVVATAVAARLGAVDVAAHQIAFEVWSFLGLGVDAIAIAGQAMVGRALGAGDGAGARAAGRRMIEWGVALGVALGLLVAALRTVLPHLFTDDTEVLALASFLLVWVAALQPVNAVAFVLDGVLIGAGDMRFLAWAMIVAAAVFIPAALAVLALDAGIGWLWASLGLLMATRASTLLARFASGRWIVLGARR
ncbi:MAG: MATE family efflux transporter [Acidimicrobiales bacterium]